jgi:hypothetical protein
MIIGALKPPRGLPQGVGRSKASTSHQSHHSAPVPITEGDNVDADLLVVMLTQAIRQPSS